MVEIMGNATVLKAPQSLDIFEWSPEELSNFERKICSKRWPLF